MATQAATGTVYQVTLRAARAIAASAAALCIISAPGLVNANDSPVETDISAAPPPRIVVFDQVADVPARVIDATGRELPLTGLGTRPTDDGLEVFVPRLPPGRFVIEAGDQRRILEISSIPGSTFDQPGPATRPVSPMILAGSFFLVGAAASWALRRRRLLAGGALILTVTGAAAAIISLGAGSGQFSGDPCLLEPPSAGTAYQCLSRHVSGVYFTAGTMAAVTELDRISASGVSEWQAVCHEVAHLLGEISWKDGQGNEELVRSGSVNCSFGYFHGILAAMGSYLPDTEVATGIGRLCQLASQHIGSQTESECAHGAGHSAMWRTNGDLPRAYQICTDSGVKLEECLSGATMEWSVIRKAAGGDARQLPEPRVESALELCRPPWGTPTPFCAEAAVFGVDTFEELTSVAELCLEMPPPGAQDCAALVAKQSAFLVPSLSSDHLSFTELLAFCDLLEGIGDSGCVREVAYGLMFTTRDVARVKLFCDQTGTRKILCLDGIERLRQYVTLTGDTSFPDLD